MSDETGAMPYTEARRIADEYVAILRPYTARCVADLLPQLDIFGHVTGWTVEMTCHLPQQAASGQVRQSIKRS